MLIFACAVTDEDVYRECAEPGIRLAAEPDSEVMPLGTAGSIFRNYNLVLDRVKDRDDFEAVVLLHQDAEIVDPEFCAKVRRGIADPEVAILGCAGAIGVRNIAWWEGSVTWAAYTHRFREMGGGEIPAMTWREDEIPRYARTGEADSIDGFVMALTPWAVRNLRFDESLGNLHGYDFDICLQARAAGRRVAIENMRVVHHHSLELISDVEAWIDAHMRVAEKWHGRLPDIGYAGGDWKYRARRAEAEASAARMVAAANEILHHARLKVVSEELRRTKESRSWRITRPMRAVTGLFRRGDGNGA
jgi:GT2 family glycosyltransferase